VIEEVQSESICGHYLPHCAVYRPSSKTTPLRPVFDASCKIDQNKSLNECLYKSPNLLDLLASFILRFRENTKAFTDIRRAFLNIWLAEEDRDYLHFLWWYNHDVLQKRTFRHQSVVFGSRSSPYLLNAVIQHR
jgi:hypothetical protein